MEHLSQSFYKALGLGVLIGSLLGCGKSINSSSTDKSLYGFTNTGGTQFRIAFPILAKNCIYCHAHSDWANYNEGDFITNGKIIANDPTQSSIYYKLTGNDSGISGNMPLGGSAMTGDEIAAIKSWVEAATP